MPKSRIGDVVEVWINGFVERGGGSVLRQVLLWMMVRIEEFLLWLPWWAGIMIVFLLGTWLYNWKRGLIYGGLMFIIAWLGQWELMCNSLTIIFSTLIITAAVGIPMGILMAMSERVNAVLRVILDAMQVIPLFVYFLPAIMIFGIGRVPSLFASLIFALPPIIKLTNMGIRGVSDSTVVAADAFGCTKLQKLVKVQLPQAIEAIAVGLNQTTIVALGMSITASIIGCKGLGLELYTALGYLDIGRSMECGLVILSLAITLDRLTQGIARKLVR